MQRLRQLHLYLGCIFAPMLLFFAFSGIWQTLDPDYKNSKALAWLSTIHTSHGLKNGSLTSAAMRYFVILTALSFILTTLLGIIMALQMSRSRRAAWSCLALGILIPIVLVAVAIAGNPRI